MYKPLFFPTDSKYKESHQKENDDDNGWGTPIVDWKRNSLIKEHQDWEKAKVYWNNFRKNKASEAITTSPMDSDMEYGPDEELDEEHDSQEDKRKNRLL